MIENSNVKPHRIWTVAEAKAKLSEVLRLAEKEGPQRIGARKTFVVVPQDVWASRSVAEKPLGQWLVDNLPRGIELQIPSRKETPREISFSNQNQEK